MAEEPHLSIGEVLGLLQEEFPDVTISKIRFLEGQGLLDPDRTPSGYRKFYDNDIHRLRWILRQQREHFLPLKIIKERLESSGGAIPEDSGTQFEVSEQHDEDLSKSETTIDANSEIDDGGLGDESSARDHTSVDSSESDGQVTARVQLDPLDTGLTDLSMTADEICRSSGLTSRQLADLVTYGILVPHNVAGVAYYSGNSVVVARIAAGFLAHGIEPRHLKRYRSAAQAEAGIYEQAVMPGMRQRDPDERSSARETLRELIHLGDQLRSAMLREALHDHLR